MLNFLHSKKNRDTITCLREFVSLFNTTEKKDCSGTSFVLITNSIPDRILKEMCIKDRTQFEAIENHVHLIEGLSRSEFLELYDLTLDICKVLVSILKYRYPDRCFYVYASASTNDDLVLRFHQKWDKEEPYMNPEKTKTGWTIRIIE